MRQEPWCSLPLGLLYQAAWLGALVAVAFLVEACASRFSGS